MSQSLLSSMPNWLNYFDTLDSTNNYAMSLVDDGMAQHGLVVWTKHQISGKGQRSKVWIDDENNLKFSLIVKPTIQPDHIFQLSMLVALTITQYLQRILPNNAKVKIKWPNDIYINDKKTAGILIENTFRGNHWNFAVIGIGLNVNQTEFPPELNNATSLKMESHQQFDLLEIITDLRSGILNELLHINSKDQKEILNSYNEHLFKKDDCVHFKNLKTGKVFEAFVTEVTATGTLMLLTPTGVEEYEFGSLEWQIN